MKKTLLLGAVIAAAGVSQANAAAFGFYTPSGGAYCDGVKYTGKAPATGFHVYDQTYCAYDNAYLGGFSGTVPDVGSGKYYTFPVSSTAGDGVGESIVLTFYINQSAKLWTLGYESTDDAIPFEIINGGTLQKGKPFAAGGKNLKQSALHVGLSKLKINK